jgi:4-hydroxyphenylacetate 3-monooxygenase
MIRTGAQYRHSIRASRDVFIYGERVKDVTVHPMFKRLVDIRARACDMAHEPATRDVMSYVEGGERHAVANKLPMTQQDWRDKRRATDCVLEEIGGVVTRIGDETVGFPGETSRAWRQRGQAMVRDATASQGGGVSS